MKEQYFSRSQKVSEVNNIHNLLKFSKENEYLDFFKNNFDLYPPHTILDPDEI